MFPKWRHCLLILLVCLPAVVVPGIAGADEVDLYRYQTLVVSQDRSERNQATADGLAEVLVRASGQQRVLQDSAVVKELSNASRYLLEYSYQSSGEQLEIDGNLRPAWRLVLRYSESEVQQLLRDARLPIWPANRPSTLVWLVMDDNQGRRIAFPQNDDGTLDSLREASERRGVPVLTPRGDLEDQAALSANAAWRLNEAAIRAASERYQPNTILVGKLSETSSGQWFGNWLLLDRDRSSSFDGRGASLETVINAGIDASADYFFQLYGYEPGEGGSRTLSFQLGGVSGFADYTSAMEYLEELALVERADLTVALGDYVLLNIMTDADVALLQDALALDRKLVPEAATTASTGGSLTTPVEPLGSPTNPLRYRWQ